MIRRALCLLLVLPGCALFKPACLKLMDVACPDLDAEVCAALRGGMDPQTPACGEALPEARALADRPEDPAARAAWQQARQPLLPPPSAPEPAPAPAGIQGRWRVAGHRLADVGAWSAEEAERLLGQEVRIEVDRLTVGAASCEATLAPVPAAEASEMMSDLAAHCGEVEVGSVHALDAAASCPEEARLPPYAARTPRGLVAFGDGVALCLEPASEGTEVGSAIPSTALSAPDMPPGVPVEGEILGALRWTDSAGENLLFITRQVAEEQDGSRSGRMQARHVLPGGEPSGRVVAEVEEPGCPEDLILGLRGPIEVVDGDGDGVGEVMFAWAHTCISDVSPQEVSLLILEGTDRYQLDGTAAVLADPGGEVLGGESRPDAAMTAAPSHLRMRADARWAADFATPQQ